MSKAQLHSENPELLLYTEGRLHITVLGGVRLSGLDRLKVTLKLTLKEKPNGAAFRHHLDLYNSIQCEQLIEKASEVLDLSSIELSAMIGHLITALENYLGERLEDMKPKQVEKRKLTEAERKTALAFLKSPNLLERTRQAIAASGLIGEETNSMIAYLTYTSRKRHTPLHLMCLGASGTGKTWLQERVSELIPEEDKLEITSLSTNAFYYFGREELKHKLLLIEDLDGAESVLYPLRELQSKRKISKTVTLKDNKGNLKTVTLNVEGPVCVSGCTTREQLYEDNANRCILLYMDNSSKQDKKIMDYQRRLSAGQVDQGREQQIRAQVKNVQRILQPITVKNPYAVHLSLPEAVFKPRRTMLLLLLFTETITYYHQYQRELKTDTDTGEQYIESTVADIETAFMLLEHTILKKSDELNDACRGFFEQLKVWLKEKDTDSFYSKEIRSALRLSPSSLGRYLYELERMGYIRIVRGNRYKGFEYKVQSWNDLEILTGDTRKLVEKILESIRSVSCNPTVTQQADGLVKVQKISRKQTVTHHSWKMEGRGAIQLDNPLYIRLQAGFTQWLRILNFDQSSQRDMPKMLTEFLSFLESHGCHNLSQIQESHLQNYLHELSEKQGKTGGGTLSLNYRRKHLQVIRKFARYLAESGQVSFEVNVRIKGKSTNIKSILTKKEVAKLYEATRETALGLRDRALLVLYYGCGLRKSEGLSLNTADILLDKELVLVRKGKGYKARYVPLTGSNKTELEHYLSYSRPYLLSGKKEDALLLSINGKRLKAAFERIGKLRSASGIKKAIGPHTLRHSIATHLLQSGMKLEQIQLFLGHSSLESTQIYTHLIDEEL